MQALCQSRLGGEAISDPFLYLEVLFFVFSFLWREWKNCALPFHFLKELYILSLLCMCCVGCKKSYGRDPRKVWIGIDHQTHCKEFGLASKLCCKVPQSQEMRKRLLKKTWLLRIAYLREMGTLCSSRDTSICNEFARSSTAGVCKDLW